MKAARPKIPRENKIDPSARLREVRLGHWIEIHQLVQVEYATLDDYCYLQELVSVSDTTMGKFCAIAAMARINAPNHPMDRATQHRFSYVPEYYWPAATRDHAFFDDRRAARCTIGHDVWIGHGAIVLPGLTIGTGAVVAAGAVVTRDVAPFTIVAGTPARPIRPRFAEPVAERLQRLAWWNWSPHALERAAPDFRDLAIEAFLDKYESRSPE